MCCRLDCKKDVEGLWGTYSTRWDFRSCLQHNLRYQPCVIVKFVFSSRSSTITIETAVKKVSVCSGIRIPFPGSSSWGWSQTNSLFIWYSRHHPCRYGRKQLEYISLESERKENASSWSWATIFSFSFFFDSWNLFVTRKCHIWHPAFIRH